MNTLPANTKLPSRILLILIILICASSYLFSQYLIGIRDLTPCLIRDLLQTWTKSANAFLNTHPASANTLIILNSLFGDLSVLMLFVFAIWRASVRPLFPLFLFMIFRDGLQLLLTFPPMPGMIWHDPGFPSLFLSYNDPGTFYFSAYVGTNVLSALERSYFEIKWVNLMGFSVVLFEAITDILLRTHYTADIYTSIIVAVFSFYITRNLSKSVDHYLQKNGKFARSWILLMIGIAAFFHYTAQHYISAKALSECGIIDLLQTLSYPINAWMTGNPSIGDAFLIGMNAIQDAIFLYIIIYTIGTQKISLYLSFSLFLILRQTLQMLVQLPVPPHIIWRDPGFSSLFQNYSITNDLYFSGHTGTTLLFALHLMQYQNKWLTRIGFLIFSFKALLMIIMQIHYTMDVFTAIITILCITMFCRLYSSRVSNFLANLF